MRNILATIFASALVGCGGAGVSDVKGTSPQPSPVLRPFQYIQVAGQSNAGQGGAGVTLELRALSQNALQFAGAASGLGYELQQKTALSTFEAARDPEGGQFVATMLGQSLAARSAEQYLVRTDWYGGKAISGFMPGTINFTNTLQAITAAKTIAGDRGIQVPWYVWIHGESGPFDRATYAAQLGAYIDDVRPAVAAASGQTALPTFVIVQTNTPDWAFPGDTPGDAVGLAQLDVSRAKPGVIMAGPMYQAPMIVDANDNIHTSSVGRMVIGEMLADVLAHGPTWKPLQPRTVTRNGAVIDIAFDVPAGALQWDTEWIAAAPNFGFSYRDNAGRSISKVEILGRDTVRVTLSGEPGTNAQLGYAQGTVDNVLDGWASGRGQLISPTGRPSFFRAHGHPVPSEINHYAVKFNINL